MSAYSFQDWYDPDGFSLAPPAPSPRAPAPRATPLPTQFVNPQTGRPWRAGDSSGTINLTPRPVMGPGVAPTQVPMNQQMAIWRASLQQPAKPAQTVQQQAKPTAPAQAVPVAAPTSTSTKTKSEDEAPSRQRQPVQQYQQPSDGIAQMFNQMHGQHFGHLQNMIGGVNAALANSSKQMSEAAARNQALQHNAWQINQASQIEMEKIKSQERMAEAERKDRESRRQMAFGLLGGGIGPMQRIHSVGNGRRSIFSGPLLG